MNRSPSREHVGRSLRSLEPSEGDVAVWRTNEWVPEGGIGTSNLLADQTLASDAATMTISGFSGAYDDLLILVDISTDNVSFADVLTMQVGNGTVDTGANYEYGRIFDGSSEGTNRVQGATLMWCGVSSSAGENKGGNRIIIQDYAARLGGFRSVLGNGVGYQGATTGLFSMDFIAFWENTTDVIDIITLGSASYNLEAGTRIRIYGLPFLGRGALIPLWKAGTVGAYDDYFLESNESDWTATSADTGTETWTYPDHTIISQDDGVHLDFADQSVGDFTAYTKDLTGIAIGDYVQTKLRLFGGYIDTADSVVGVGFTDGTTTAANSVFGGMNQGADERLTLINGHGTLASMTTFPFQEIAPTSGHLHLRCTYSAANTFQFSVSMNGRQFTQLGANISKTMTPTRGGFMASTYGASEDCMALFQYFHSNVTS